MSKCSKCQNDFTPLIKNNGLPYKTCDICRCTSNKYKDTHKEYTKEYGIYYRELNKDILKEKAKEYFEKNKDKIYAKNKLDRIEIAHRQKRRQTAFEMQINATIFSHVSLGRLVICTR